MPKLLAQVRLTLRARHYSIRTEQSYVSWIRDFIIFHEKRHPKELDARHISSWLSHLATDRQVAASTQNQALSALLFLYRDVLKSKQAPSKTRPTTYTYYEDDTTKTVTDARGVVSTFTYNNRHQPTGITYSIETGITPLNELD